MSEQNSSRIITWLIVALVLVLLAVILFYPERAPKIKKVEPRQPVSHMPVGGRCLLL